jgi:hypothetical protein
VAAQIRLLTSGHTHPLGADTEVASVAYITEPVSALFANPTVWPSARIAAVSKSEQAEPSSFAAQAHGERLGLSRPLVEL